MKHLPASFLALTILCTAQLSYADNLLSSSCTQNAGNAVVSTAGFAVGQYCSSISLPAGTGFASHSQYPNNFMVHTASGHILAGWARYAVAYVTSGYDGIALRLRSENRGDGCSGTYCSALVHTLIFTRFNGSDWAYRGLASVDPNSYSTHSIFLPGPVDEVLLARSAHGDSIPDPRWYEVTVEYFITPVDPPEWPPQP